MCIYIHTLQTRKATAEQIKAYFQLQTCQNPNFLQGLMVVHFSTRFYMPTVHLLKVDRFWGFTQVNLPYDTISLLWNTAIYLLYLALRSQATLFKARSCHKDSALTLSPIQSRRSNIAVSNFRRFLFSKIKKKKLPFKSALYHFIFCFCYLHINL